MYIKINNIKKFLLISACVFFAGFNYLTYVKAEDTTVEQAACDKTIDTDCDGLTNTEETLYKTDSNNADTDNDGYSDGVEIKSGYDPTIPAPGDRVTQANTTTTSNLQNIPTAGSASLTNDLIRELQDYTESKSEQAITSADLQSFMNTSLIEKTGTPMTWETLPLIDESQIKILSQSYTSLSETARKEKLQQDSLTYLTKIGYLLGSNSPAPIFTDTEAQAFKENFQIHLNSLSTLNPDLAYFSDFGDRLELFSNQINNIEVPETMVAIHIKFLRLIEGFLSMRENASPVNDPVAGMIALRKVSGLIDLTVDFFENDAQNYFNQFQETKE